ncbi:MAG: glycosyltransferase family 4 protein [Bryobacteraceae bacterium]
MRKPHICLAVPSFWPRDAVGNDVLGMRECLIAAGYDVTILATWMDKGYERYARPLNPNDPIVRSRNNILIYHHSICWEAGERLFEKARARVVIRYHSITPPDFFRGYAQHYYDRCASGLAGTARLVRLPGAVFWGTSSFTVDDLIRLGAPPERCRVIPPIHRIETELACAPFDSVITGDYRKTHPNILFVGGFRPNKGHVKAVEVFAAYRRLSDTPARLVFVGNLDPSLNAYVDKVQARAAALGVGRDVHFAFSTTPSQLRAYYMTSSVFLCTSEHEGFCVPLAEAMFFRSPIVAWPSTAVGETCGAAGRVFREFDPDAMAAAIEECAENPATSLCLADCGRREYESRFQLRVVGKRLLELVREMEQL